MKLKTMLQIHDAFIASICFLLVSVAGYVFALPAVLLLLGKPSVMSAFLALLGMALFAASFAISSLVWSVLRRRYDERRAWK